MSIAFSGLNPDQAFIYMDDIIVIGFSDNHHIQNLKKVFETCRKFNLNEVYFLGHKCSNGILPDPTKLHAVHNYPRPSNKEETKRFTAFANYYRRFIKNFSGIAKPLNALTGKKTEFVDDYVRELKYKLQVAHKETKTLIDKMKKRNKEYYDKKINPVNFKEGDKVKIQVEPYDKFKFTYSGPFEILDIQNENLIIDLHGRKYRINKNRVLKY